MMEPDTEAGKSKKIQTIPFRERLKNVLLKMCGESVTIQGAGRTDAGVHAKGQVANAVFDTEKTCEEICAYLNYYLPEDIEIVSVTKAEERFHSRLRQQVYVVIA